MLGTLPITATVCMKLFIGHLHLAVAGDTPNFRILAPEFVCPSDEESVIEKLDNTVITVKTESMDLQLSWTVRWLYLDAPLQRFTLLLWRTVRALEAKLNAQQPEPYVYIINNAELLQGVEYVFNVTGADADDIHFENGTTKSFSIDNFKGNPKLMIEGRSEKLSVLLIGGETVYADMEYVMEAEVTTCSPTQDYYFAWSVVSESANPLTESNTSGSRLEISPYSLQAGASYYVTCMVYRNSGEFVVQTELPFQVLHRGLVVHLNVDFLVVAANNGFDIKAVVENHDYHGEVVKFEWNCVYGNDSDCKNFESVDSKLLSVSSGFPLLGQYEITLSVTVQDQQATANVKIIVVESTLPVIKIQPEFRVVNEYSMVTLTVNASNVAPSCTLTWYFANEEYLASASLYYNNTCDYDSHQVQHGEALPGSVTILSLEENFLNELTDFTNETEWRQVTAEMTASTGRARFVAQCGCSLIFNCETQGTVYADVNFKLNKSPNVTGIKVSPETGTAMETIFRLSTLAASDSDKPLRYTFYCSLGANDSVMLASNLDHLAVETFLPYIAAGTDTWVEVCDSLGACSSSEVMTVQLLEGEARTMQALVNSMRSHIARCETILLARIVKATIATYTNANQAEFLSKFTNILREILSTAKVNCSKKGQEEFYKLLDWLFQAGIDTSSLIE